MDQASTTIDQRTMSLRSADGAESELILIAPEQPSMGVLLLPAMGVPARNYRPFAEQLATAGFAVAVHEWRGIGSSSQRAGRHCDWNYRQLLQLDLPESFRHARQAWPNLRWLLAGHSLGGQLGSLSVGLDMDVDGLVLLASGAPAWRSFPARQRWPLRCLFAVAPMIARLRGYFPGRRLGFGGNEARGVIADWARSGRSGNFVPAQVATDLELGMRRSQRPILAILYAEDAFAPAGSLQWLLGKFPQAPIERALLGAAELGTRADHFAWMRAPQSTVHTLQAWAAAQFLHAEAGVSAHNRPPKALRDDHR